MADDPKLKGRDKSSVDAEQPYEVDHIHRHFPELSKEDVIEAIRAKGPARNAVITFLETKNRKRKQEADGSM